MICDISPYLFYWLTFIRKKFWNNGICLVEMFHHFKLTLLERHELHVNIFNVKIHVGIYVVIHCRHNKGNNCVR